MLFISAVFLRKIKNGLKTKFSNHYGGEGDTNYNTFSRLNNAQGN